MCLLNNSITVLHPPPHTTPHTPLRSTQKDPCNGLTRAISEALVLHPPSHSPPYYTPPPLPVHKKTRVMGYTRAISEALVLHPPHTPPLHLTPPPPLRSTQKDAGNGLHESYQRVQVTRCELPER